MIIIDTYPKENPMKDLDQSDVNKDAEDMMTKEIEQLSEDLDGCDLYSIIMVLVGEDIIDDDLDSRVIKQLIHTTQSNPEKAYAALVRIKELDDAIADL